MINKTQTKQHNHGIFDDCTKDCPPDKIIEAFPEQPTAAGEQWRFKKKYSSILNSIPGFEFDLNMLLQANKKQVAEKGIQFARDINEDWKTHLTQGLTADEIYEAIEANIKLRAKYSKGEDE